MTAGLVYNWPMSCGCIVEASSIDNPKLGAVHCKHGRVLTLPQNLKIDSEQMEERKTHIR
jgi:hypothetical protein